MSNEQLYIKANNVTGEAIAVGPYAQANSYRNCVQDKDLGPDVATLRATLASLGLTEGQHASVARDVYRLDAALRATPPDKQAAGSHLKSITDKLEFAGKAVNSVAGLIEPVKTITAAIGLTLKAVGLG